MIKLLKTLSVMVGLMGKEKNLIKSHSYRNSHLEEKKVIGLKEIRLLWLDLKRKDLLCQQENCKYKGQKKTEDGIKPNEIKICYICFINIVY